MYSRLLETIPGALAAPYESVDSRIRLYRGELAWHGNGKTTRMPDALVVMDLAPTPHLWVEGRLPAHEAFGDWFATDHRVELPPLTHVPTTPGADLPDLAEGEGDVVQLGPPKGFAVGIGRSVQHIDFLVINYPHLLGTAIKYRDGSTHAGRLEFASSEWSITLDSVDAIDQSLKRYGETGAMGVTHTGRLHRSDGKRVDRKSGLLVLEALHYFLCFTAGRGCAPLLPVGYSRKQIPVWAVWRAPAVAPGAGAWQWVESGEGFRQLIDLWPGFMSLWNDPQYHDAIRIAVGYYLDANQPTTLQRAIVLGQVALEALAYAHLSSGLTGVATWIDAPPMHANIREALKSLHIPRGIPEKMTLLRRIKPTGWKGPWDGPSVVTWMRNEVVHARKRAPKNLQREWVQVWKLSTWYVEMCMLALCKYQGNYVTRIDSSRSMEVQTVPWAKKPR
jgi:hypothetical protein